MIFPRTILTTAYFPPVEYFFAIAQSGKVVLEQHELYQKQSYRNRCRIFSANGVEQLTIPVVKDEIHARPVRDIRIDYSEAWLQRHTRAFEAAYNSSPFYLYYKDDIVRILDRKPEFLFDLNMALLEFLLESTGIRADVTLTEEYVKEYPDGDFRARIQPKYKGESLLKEYKKEKTYYQVFSEKLGFQPNLSVLDLLCNEGPNASTFLL